ncbi:MAG: hypothetical protein JW384_02320 [Nitrosomonadaceae bacterium]|nr:hypothetical protein [Nitrosomonadaceae bacterium]
MSRAAPRTHLRIYVGESGCPAGSGSNVEHLTVGGISDISDIPKSRLMGGHIGHSGQGPGMPKARPPGWQVGLSG